MTSEKSKIKYRPDIDGLRALAIIPVVIYHAFPNYAPGGFVGVDIFFVISGFLISLIIFRSLNNDDFSFLEFYTHRINRIFPSLILVITACYLVGWFTLLPDEFKQLGKHIASGIGFIQNFILWNESGYFDVTSELKPLMHLWSLAVEEQFYLIFPLLAWAAWKVKLNILTGLIILGVISLIFNLNEIENDSVKTFFSPQTRFWELIVGSVIAYFYAFDRWKPSFNRNIQRIFFNKLFFSAIPSEENRGRLLSSAISIVGLILILYSVITYDHNIPYPGSHALIPVLGASFLIIAGPKALINHKILSNKVAVWVGLISYPLYLWHWPLLSFARIVESETPSLYIRIAAVIISLILSASTFYFIEKKVRYAGKTSKKVAILSILAILLGYLGYNTYSRDGLMFRDAAKVSKINKFDYPYKNKCDSITGEEYNDDWCNTSPIGDSEINALLIGDSFSNSYSAMMKEFAKQKISKGNYSFSPIQIARGQCPMLLDYGPKYCQDITNAAIKIASENKIINTIILSLDWPAYHNGKDFHWVNHYENSDKFWSSLEKTTQHYMESGKRIVFLLAPPRGVRPRSCTRPVKITDKNLCEFTLIEARNNEGGYREKLIDFSNHRNIEYFDPFPVLCPNDYCTIIDNNKKILWSDAGHMSQYGGEFLAFHASDALERIFVKDEK